MTTPRGRHRKLRRNILHTVIATALLAGTFTVVDQSINPAPANAAPGDPGSLDTSFASVTPITGLKFTMGIQSNGKIIATPDYGLPIARYNQDGSVDSSFTFTATHSTSVFVNPQDDSFFVTRFGTSGSLVQKRLATGLTGSGTWDSAQKGRGNYSQNFALIDANTLLVASEASINKLNITTGASDAAFASNVASNPIVGYPTQVKIQTVAGVKKILVSTTTGNFGGSLVRYNLDGTLDKVIFSNKDFMTVEVVNVGGSNMILAGERTEGTLHVFNEDGTAATNQFAQNIKAAANFGPSAQGLGPRSIVVDASGRIVVGGTFTSPSQRLFRFNSDGTADSSFNSNVGTSFPSDVTQVLVSSPTTILVAGAFGIKRVWSDPPTIPILTGTTVSADGLTVTLNYVSNLGTNAPAASAFAVTNAGTTIPVQNVAISNKSVVLTLSSPIGKSNPVTLSYTAPTADPAAGNSAIEISTGADEISFSLTTGQVTNSSTVDQTGPIFVSGSTSVDGLTVTAVFDETLKSVTAIPSNFVVSVNGEAVTPSAVSMTGANLTLTLASAIERNQTVTLAYNPPAIDSQDAGAAVQDNIGNRTLAFTGKAITNNSSIDTKGPTLVSAVVASAGTSITLTYNEALHTVLSDFSAFTVTVDGQARAVTAISRPTTTTISLTLASAVDGGAAVSISYSAPDSNNALTNGAIQDSAGIDSLSFTNFTGTNSSSVGRPVISSVVVSAVGTNIKVNYNKSAAQPSFTDFKWYLNGELIPMSSSGLGVSGPSVTFSPVSPVITTRDVVTYTYTEPNQNSTTLRSVTNGAVTNSSTVVDTTPPTLTSAVLATNGTYLTLTYSEPLGTPMSGNDALSVTAAGSIYSVARSAVSGSSIFLMLERPIPSGLDVRFNYTAPVKQDLLRLNPAIQDAAGNDADLLTGRAVTNNSTQPQDVTGPKPTTLVYSGNTVTITFDESLGSTTAQVSRFTANVGVDPAVVQAVAYLAPNKVVLTLAETIPADSRVTITYTPPASSSQTSNLAIQDGFGNDALSFMVSDKYLDSPWTWEAKATANPNCRTNTESFMDSSRKRTMPNGVTYSIGVSGPNLCLDPYPESLSERGGIDQQFASIGSSTDPGAFIHHPHPADDSECGPKTPGITEYCVRPDSFVTIKFDEPVTNPVMSFAGWGSAASSISWSEMRLVTPNLTLTHLPGTVSTNILLEQGGTYLRPGSFSPSTKCGNATGNGAGCGSFIINGTITEAKFSLVWAANGNDWGNTDDWNIVTSVTEDFGYAPTTYDQGNAASHVYGTLRLGSAVNPDNLGYLYSKINYEAVQSGAAIPAGEDALSSWPTVGAAGTQYVVPITFGGATKAMDACGWIDFNINGTFDTGERACTRNIASTATTANLTWVVPQDVKAGSTYSRIRLSHDQILMPYGKLASGEVEDYALTVGPPPLTANPDVTSGGQDLNQTINLLTNPAGADTPGSAPIVASSVKLCAPPQVAPNCNATSVTVAGVGTYTVSNTGVMTFDPLPTFTGTPAPLAYTVTDSNGVKDDSTYTPTVIAKPTAFADTTSGPQGVAQSIVVTNNDSAAAGQDLVTPSVTLSCPATPATPTCVRNANGTVTITGQGTYSASAADGTVVFTPLPTFTGTAKPVVYTVKDDLDQSATSTYTPTVIPAPVAVADTSKNGQDINQTINVLGNDTIPANGNPLDPTSVKLCALADASANPPVAAEVSPNCSLTSLTVPGEGTYTVNPTTGVITFDPEPGFTGPATRINYQVSDTGTGANKQTTSSTINATVVPAPTARPDTTTGGQGLPQSTNLLTNTAGSDSAAPGQGGNLVPTSVRLCDVSATPAEVAPNCTVAPGTPVVVDGVGSYVVDATGKITFTPEPGFTGSPDPLPYTVADNYGVKASSTYTPNVVPGPDANPDTTTGGQGLPQTINLLTNPDGTDTAASGATLVASSVKLCAASEVAPNCTKTSVTIADVGTYSVDATGKMTFTPVAGFTGTPAPLAYTVTDSNGVKDDSTYTPTVIAKPTAFADTTSGPQGVAQSIVVTNNDSAAAGQDLVTPSVTLSCPATPATPTCVRNANGTVTITGQGTYSASAADGTVVFTPLPTFTGTAKPVVYTVKDDLDQSATSTYTPTVIPAPVAVADTSKNGQDINQTINVLGNDTIPANGNPLDPTSVKLCALADASANPPVAAEVSPNCSLTSLTVPGEGTYTVNPTTGVITFDPEPGFTGPATRINYQVSDTGTGANKQTTSSTINATVVPAPTARPDTTTGGQGLPQSTNLLTNTAGSDSAAPGQGGNLVPTSVRLCDVSATPAEVAPNCTVAPGTPVVVDGVGSYVVDATGKITFTPEPGFTGSPDPLPYTVADNYGVKASSTYTPNVVPGPDANPDTTTGGQGLPQTINLLTNPDGTDTAASGATLVASSVKLCAASEVAPNCTKTSVTIADVGTYSVDATGKMTFTPVAGFTGTPAPLAYTVTDSNGVKDDSTYTPTVIAKPVARPDTTTGNKDVNQVVNLVTNPSASGADSAGVAGLNLDPSTVRLCTISPAQTPPNCTATTLTVAGVGTYTVDATGQMTFDPLPTFTGTPAPVKYIVKDETGQVANSTYTPTVLAPPTVKPDTSVGPANTAQTRNVITNTVNTSDTANSGATLDLTSLAIACPSVPATPSAIAPGLAAVAKPAAVTCTVGPNGEVIMAGQGTYTIDPAKPGFLIFTPEPTFTGTATGVSYSITDSNGQVSSTTYTPTVIPAPTARDDYSVAEQGATQWISPVGNDTSSTSAKLVPGTVLLCRTGEPPPDCEATEVVIPGQGTFTVSAYGVVKFVPEPGFTGTVTPLNYQVADSLGQKTDATIFVEVLPPPAPSATMDTGSADYNKPVTLSPWLNDFAGTKPDGSESNLAAPALVPTSIRLCTTVQTPPNCNATRVTTVDGTYVVDTKTGKVVFTPVNGFTGTVTAPVTYQISNNWSGFAGPGVATSILVPTINPPGAPAATVDVTTTKPGVSVVIVPVGNDKPGSAPLNPKTIRLCGANEISPSCTQTSVTTLDGTYVVDTKTGHVTFTPRAGFTGKATIPYVITDTLGKKANSNLIITVKDSAQSPVVKPVVDKPELPKTGGTRPDLLLLLGLVAIAGAGGLRFAGRRK
jgi:uncharacterized repeat protein (TIGR02059 family)/LPXTG-motif cell wall-anchored protein